MYQTQDFFARLLFLLFLLPLTLRAQIKDDTSVLIPIDILSIRSRQTTPMTFQTIDKEALQQNNLSQDVPFVLQQTSSLVAYSDAGNGVGYTGLRLRGSDLTRLNVTLNGVPYNDPESQSVYFVNIPNLRGLSQSVQIQRGVGGSSNGGSAFGGGIHFSTHKPISEKPSVSYSLDVASFETLKQSIFLSSGLLHQYWNIDFAASLSKSAGYVDRASSDLKSFYMSVDYKPNERTSLHLNYLLGSEKTYHAWYGVIDTLLYTNRTFNPAGLIIDDNFVKVKSGLPYENQTDNYTQQHIQLFYSTQLTPQISLNNTLFTTIGKGYYEEYKYGNLSRLFTTDTDYVRRLYLENVFYGNLFSLNYTTNRTKISLGVNLQRYEGNHYGVLLWVADRPDLANQTWYKLTAHKNDINGFVKIDAKIAPFLTAYADMQIRYIDYQMNGFRKTPDTLRQVNYLFVNPKVGISFQKGNLRSFLSYSIGQKEPNRSDFENRPDLPQAEFLQDIELGTHYQTSKLSYQNTLFAMFYTNQLIMDGTIDDIGNYLRKNTLRSYRIGVENEFAYTFSKALSLSGNLTYGIHQIQNYEYHIIDYTTGLYRTHLLPSTDLAFAPRLLGAYQLKYQMRVPLTFLLSGRYVGMQYIDNTSDVRKSLKPYYTQDISLIYSYVAPLYTLTLRVGVRNVFNTLYETNAYLYEYYQDGALSSHQYYFPMMGRNYFLNMTFSLR